MNNPQAFPISGSQYKHTQGMTLRDYFAAKAMQAWESRSDLDDISDASKAKSFYDLADAMLKARET
jgi:hypothetical protein